MHKPVTKISFNPKVKRLTVEQFITRFQPIYPEADLQAYANELGLISEAVAPEAPPAIPSLVDGAECWPPKGEEALTEEAPATSSKTSKQKGGKK